MIALCGICRQPMSGSRLVDLNDPRLAMGIYMVHLVDEHWQLLERVHATTGDPGGRTKLFHDLTVEFDRAN